MRPYKAKAPVGTKVDKNGKTQVVYKSLGNFTTRAEAEDALAEFSKNPYDISLSVKTFADLYNVWSEQYFDSLQGENSVRTITSAYAYCSDLYNMPIRNIGPGHIKDAMKNGYVISTRGEDKGQKRYASLSTQERIKSMCNLMFDYAVEHRILTINPAREFKINALLSEIKKKSKGKIPFTTEQVNKLWQYLDDIPYVDMVLIALYTGFRPQELAVLEVDNVFLDENKLVGGMKTEAGTDRVVPIHPAIKNLVERRYIQATEKFHSDRLFNDPKGQQGTRMTYDKYRNRFMFVMREMGFEGLTPHCTRHTFATQAKRSGMDAGIIKRILGHSLSGDITESVYIHPTFDDLLEEMKKLDYTANTLISPLNKAQMDKIAYDSEGKIYTKPKDEDMERDINEVLLLNGIQKKDGTVRDTSTELLKGRKDAYNRAKKMMAALNTKGKCTSATLKKIIDELYNREERDEFVGVQLYYFRKHYNSLIRRGM